MATAKPRFFRTQADFRRWLARNHKTKSELLVGFYKVDSGKPSMTWPESVDQALCYGWIDGIRRRLDDVSYCIRFTPRKRGSKWSDVNLKKVEFLKRKKLMRAAGLAAYDRRIEGRRAGYSYDENIEKMSPEMEEEFRSHKRAWAFFEKQPPSWRKKVEHWLTSAKQESTRRRRLRKLIEGCDKGHLF
jgi:uncharacterized protein YdeI (YjbR/CyaY-like superfamily)